MHRKGQHTRYLLVLHNLKTHSTKIALLLYLFDQKLSHVSSSMFPLTNII